MQYQYLWFMFTSKGIGQVGNEIFLTCPIQFFKKIQRTVILTSAGVNYQWWREGADVGASLEG